VEGSEGCSEEELEMMKHTPVATLTEECKKAIALEFLNSTMQEQPSATGSREPGTEAAPVPTDGGDELRDAFAKQTGPRYRMGVSSFIQRHICCESGGLPAE